jgi:tyrosine-protein phosphatase SIW14
MISGNPASGAVRLPLPFQASLLLALGLCASTAAESRAQSSPVAPAREQRAGLPHFGAVSDQLYRGAQPQDVGFAELKKLGIDIVVNLRHEPAEIARERTLVEAQGMRYVSIPWRGRQDPKTEQVSQFLTLLRENPDRKVFVHCQRGAERTGVMVGCYRISRDGWTPDRALAEMQAFRFRGGRFDHLARFVREFPSLLLRDPFLKAAASAAVP